MMMTLAVTVLALTGQLPAPAAPPPVPAARAATTDDPSLAKVRERLYRNTFTMPPLADTGTTFRVSIEAWQRPAKDLWTEKTTVAAYVRPTFPIYHHEFLMQVTPELFRSATVHPTGVPVIYLGEKLVELAQEMAAAQAQAAARRKVQTTVTDFLKKKTSGK